MTNLDRPQDYLYLDTQGQFKWMGQWPEMLETGFKSGQSLKIPSIIKINKINLDYSKKCTNIIICGMGGSAISGEFLQNFLAKDNEFKVPISIVRGYSLPKYVDHHSLTLVISYSGNTREALVCLYAALKQASPVIIVSSGGTAIEVSKKHNLPFIQLPTGFQPRAAFPLLFSTLAGLIAKRYPHSIQIETELTKTIDYIRSNGQVFVPDSPLSENLAKQYAIKWYKNLKPIPIFITEYSAIGMRMKGQINENANLVAYYDIFPEFMHNSVQGLKDSKIDNYFYFLIQLASDSSEMIDKVLFSLKLAHPEENYLAEVIRIEAPCFLAELFFSIYLIDYMSLYIAILQEYDPSEIEIISRVKEEFGDKLNSEFDVKKALMWLDRDDY